MTTAEWRQDNIEQANWKLNKPMRGLSCVGHIVFYESVLCK